MLKINIHDKMGQNHFQWLIPKTHRIPVMKLYVTSKLILLKHKHFLETKIDSMIDEQSHYMKDKSDWSQLKKKRDWAGSDLHNSRQVEHADLSAKRFHPNWLGTVTEGQITSIMTDCKRSKSWMPRLMNFQHYCLEYVHRMCSNKPSQVSLHYGYSAYNIALQDTQQTNVKNMAFCHQPQDLHNYYHDYTSNNTYLHNFMFCWPCISIYVRNETNLMHYLSSAYWVAIPLHVLGLLVAHHQEVTMYICDNWYVLYVLADSRQSTKTHNTYQLSHIYIVTSWWLANSKP
jgi:hypothetical protein